MSKRPLLGVIGGTGLYDMPHLKVTEERVIETPFGEPSSPYVIGEIQDTQVIFLSRHGRGHRFLPQEINYRANIYGFKQLGVEQILAISAVGSMKKTIRPGDFVVVDQFFDRTRTRPATFFGDGLVAHVSLADPVCPRLSELVAQAASHSGATVHRGGTYLCIEGPQFSTRAESSVYRTWGVDVIGMTNLSEARLAREAELCFSTLALATDYDCWHESEADVDVETVMAVIADNANRAQDTVMRLCGLIATSPRTCACGSALAAAITSDHEVISNETATRLALLVGKYLDQ